MKFFTYKITNSMNNKVYYGWTNKDPIEKRLEVHVHTAKKGSKLLFHNAIRKWGHENFIIELVNSFETKEEVITDEIKLITENKTNHCRYPNGGYNMTDGGEGSSGYKRSEAAKKKTADANRGRVSEKRGKTYEEIYGDNAEEQKNIRAVSNKGRKDSPKLIEEKRERMKGNRNGCFAVEATFADGSVVTYSSRAEAMKELNIKTMTTLHSIATSTRYCSRKKKRVPYNSPYNFTLTFLRTKI